MAKFIVKATEERKQLKSELELYITNNVIHDLAFFEQNSDFVIEIKQDGISGATHLKTSFYDQNEDIQLILRGIVGEFIDNGFKDASWPSKGYSKTVHEKPTLLIYTGRNGQEIDQELWAELIANGIFKHFRKDDVVVPNRKKERSGHIKRTFEKQHYDRNYNQENTNNVSKLFKR
jgi:hypothetical protein